MAITVYSKPNCVQCGATYRALDQVRALGYAQAPVVVAGEDHWSGFRPDKIKALAVAVEALAV